MATVGQGFACLMSFSFRCILCQGSTGGESFDYNSLLVVQRNKCFWLVSLSKELFNKHTWAARTLSIISGTGIYLDLMVSNMVGKRSQHIFIKFCKIHIFKVLDI